MWQIFRDNMMRGGTDDDLFLNMLQVATTTTLQKQ
jgi:hypothetical protein